MFGPGEAGCFREVAALYSDHYRQVPLYIKCLDQGRLSALDRWLHYTVTTIGRFHCTHGMCLMAAAGCFQRGHSLMDWALIACNGESTMGKVRDWV